MVGMTRSIAARILIAVIVAAALAAPALALSKEHVYHGKARRYQSPAEINARKVFMAIPAYREIIDKNIEKDSALYIIKLKEANEIFVKVLARYANEHGYDLVCEEGHVEGAVNITEEIVAIIGDASP